MNGGMNPTMENATKTGSVSWIIKMKWRDGREDALPRITEFITQGNGLQPRLETRNRHSKNKRWRWCFLCTDTRTQTYRQIWKLLHIHAEMKWTAVRSRMSLLLLPPLCFCFCFCSGWPHFSPCRLLSRTTQLFSNQNEQPNSISTTSTTTYTTNITPPPPSPSLLLSLTPIYRTSSHQYRYLHHCTTAPLHHYYPQHL